MKDLIKFFVGILVKMGILTPKRTARLKFFYKMRKWPDFEHPKDVNEKINWMKFYGDTSMWHIFADKYGVRNYLESLGLGHTLIPLIGKWDSVEDIDWDKLPQQFVMKCNNGSGDVVVCKDKSKLDIAATKRHFSKMLNEKLSVLSGEPHYAKINPCIIAEQLLDASTQPCNSTSLVDYKIWAFNGKPMFIFAAWNRKGFHANVATFDMNWEFHPEWSVWTNHYIKPDVLLPKPKCFDEMMNIASVLSKGQPVARIDLYEVNGKVYFGEITMTSQGGYMDYYTKEFLNKMGELTHLSTDKRI